MWESEQPECHCLATSAVQSVHLFLSLPHLSLLNFLSRW